MFSKINIMTSASFMLHLPDMTLSVSLFSTFLNLFVLGVSLESLDLLWEPIWKFFRSDKCGSHGGTTLIRSLTKTEPAARSGVSYLPWLPHLWDLLQHIPHRAVHAAPSQWPPQPAYFCSIGDYFNDQFLLESHRGLAETFSQKHFSLRCFLSNPISSPFSFIGVQPASGLPLWFLLTLPLNFHKFSLQLISSISNAVWYLFPWGPQLTMNFFLHLSIEQRTLLLVLSQFLSRIPPVFVLPLSVVLTALPQILTFLLGDLPSWIHSFKINNRIFGHNFQLSHSTFWWTFFASMFCSSFYSLFPLWYHCIAAVSLHLSLFIIKWALLFPRQDLGRNFMCLCVCVCHFFPEAL